MFKKIQQKPPKEVEFPSTESADDSPKTNIKPTVTISGIPTQQPSTDSSKMFNTMKLGRANHTGMDPVELFLKAVNKNPSCSKDYVAISQDLSKGNFSDSSLAFYCIKKGRLAS